MMVKRIGICFLLSTGWGMCDDVMSEKYRALWSPAVQQQIDADIENYRKADCDLTLSVQPGTSVQVEQLTHTFLFGGNMFLFGDLKTAERDAQYKKTYTELFNAATVAFYWKTLELERGVTRYDADSPFIYRRPPTDPVVTFCASNAINMNGHAVIYGHRKWGHPEWMPEDREVMAEIFEAHVKQVAERYCGRVQRWDIVNEPTDQANRGMMPDDYVFKTFQWAERYYLPTTVLAINDADLHWDLAMFGRYLSICKDVLARGARVNAIGIQSHIFSAQEPVQIAAGAPILTPQQIRERLDCMAAAKRPLHISEVTICAPDATDQGARIQAEIARNLYRLWFSYPLVYGITWWNVVDGGAAEGEPACSGLYTPDMVKKPVYETLRTLIHETWKTRLTLQPTAEGKIHFRGFKGQYRVAWIDPSGTARQKEVRVGKAPF